MINKSSIDGQIGLKIKIKRNSLGMTQSVLADKVGVTFQQVQKYEKGVNKVSISKLYEIAKALETNVDYFLTDDGVSSALNDCENGGFYSCGNKTIDKKNVSENQNCKKEIINLVKYFTKIKNKKLRSGIINMVKSCSLNNEED